MLYAKLYFILFGLISAIGGTIGYIKANSLPSIIAGGISGVLLILAALAIPTNPRFGCGLALIVSLALAGRFVPAAVRGAQTGLYMGPLAVIGAIVALYTLFQAGK